MDEFCEFVFSAFVLVKLDVDEVDRLGAPRFAGLGLLVYFGEKEVVEQRDLFSVEVGAWDRGLNEL